MNSIPNFVFRPRSRSRRPWVARTLLGSLLAVSTFACAGTTGTPGAGTGTAAVAAGPSGHVTPQEVSDAVRRTNDLGFRVYRELARRRPGESFLFSPASLAQTLALSALGARGVTQAALTPFVGPYPDRFALALAALGDSLQSRPGGRLAPVPGLWIAPGAPLDKVFFREARHLAGSPEHLDLSSPDTTRARLSRWAEARAPVPPDLFDADVAMSRPGSGACLFTGVIGVRGSWRLPFLTSFQWTVPFTGASGAVHEIPVARTVDAFRHAYLPDARLVEARYVDLRASLLVFMPDSTQGLPALETLLLPDSLDSWAKKLAVRHVDLSLPITAFRGSLDVARDLEGLGLGDLFAPGADWSGLDAKGETRPAGAWLGAALDIRENGSLVEEPSPKADPRLTATASSFYSMIRCDHPFAFALRDDATGLLLLLGRMTEAP